MLSTPGCRRHSAEVLILSADYPDRQSADNNSRDRDGRSQAWPAPAGVLIMRKLTMAAAAAAAALILSGCEVVADSLIDAMFEDDYEYGYYDDDYYDDMYDHDRYDMFDRDLDDIFDRDFDDFFDFD